MKVKTTELQGEALDRAVAKCEDEMFFTFLRQPSTDWAQGGPIIEREKIECLYDGVSQWYVDAPHGWYEGPTPLIAAMRCYVASKLGDEITLPEELK